MSRPEIHFGQFRLVERLARATGAEEVIDAMGEPARSADAERVGAAGSNQGRLSGSAGSV